MSANLDSASATPIPFLIYGANGYTGELIARAAVQRGLRPVLGGRNRAEVSALADELALRHCVFALDEPAVLEAELADVGRELEQAGVDVDKVRILGQQYAAIERILNDEFSAWERLAQRAQRAQRPA